VLDYRDETVARLGLRLVVAHVQDYLDDGRLRERPDGTRNPLQTVPLLDAIEANRFDAVFGGGRRDEEKARAKERVFSLRDAFGAWDPRRQRPELWDLYNGRHAPGEHVRVFPLSNWTELDVWRYIERERIVLPDLYYAHEREVFRRDGMWLTAGRWGGPKPGEPVETRTVRYRTVGDMSCTGAVESTAATTVEVIVELAASRLTERGATRADDRLSEAAMEDRKKQGYF
jgi:sulfate adenylyltransferase subunit 2